MQERRYTSAYVSHLEASMKSSQTTQNLKSASIFTKSVVELSCLVVTSVRDVEFSSSLPLFTFTHAYVLCCETKFISTVEPLQNGHLRDRRKWPLWRGGRCAGGGKGVI